MAHDIYTINGRKQMFTAERKAWHDELGTYLVGQAQTADQAMELAGLNVEFLEAPIYTHWGNPAEPNGFKSLLVEDFKAIVRRDTKAQKVVGKGFKVYQPKGAFNYIDALIESKSAHYVSAGFLGDGFQMWILARVPAADFAVGGEDKHETYLLFCCGFDGTMARITKLTAERVVCRNTLEMALAGAGAQFKVKNTKNADVRMDAAQRMITGAVVDAKALEQKLNTLADRKLNRETVTAILDRLFPKTAGKDEQGEKILVSSAKREVTIGEILASYEINDGDAFPSQRGTAFNLLNAITDYTDHMRGTRVADENSILTPAMARAQSSMFGSGAQLKQEAVQVITEMTANAPTIGRTIYATAPVQNPSNGGGLLDAILSQN